MNFKSIGKVKVLDFSFRGGDTITFSLLTEKDFSKQIPVGYNIQKAFTDSLNIPILLYDLEESKIIEFFERNRIMDYEVENLNIKNYW